jgi:hypothetical protein
MSVAEWASLCYNVPDSSIYGEITKRSIQKWAEATPLDGPIHIIDLGSGSGRSMSYYASFFAPQSVILTGFEMCSQRVKLSLLILPRIKPKNVLQWSIIEKDIMMIKQLPKTATHCMSFDKTFPTRLMTQIEMLQRKSNLIYVVTTKKSHYPSLYWNLLQTISSRQHGSSCGVCFYVFQRKK